MTWKWFKSDNQTLEDLLKPGEKAQPLLDLAWVGVLVAMGVLLPVWPAEAARERAFNDVVGQMLSPYLLPALGMLLAMRMGAIDLSVWANMALGGAVAAATIIAFSNPTGGAPTHSPAWGLAAGAAAGLAVGLLSGVIVWRLRIPSPIVTIIVAGIITMAMAWRASGTIHLPDAVFVNWHIEQTVSPENLPPGAQAENEGPVRVVAPISVTRMLLVVGALAATMIVLMAASSGRKEPSRDRRHLVPAMTASGLLSALGGAIWLVEYQSTPVPDQLIGTWRIPAAALLAGSLLLPGPGRTLLTGIFLPAAMALVVAWRGQWPCVSSIADVQLIALIAMAIVAQVALTKTKSGHALSIVAASLSLIGLLAVSGAGRLDQENQQHLLRMLGLVLTAASVVLLVISGVTLRKRLSSSPRAPGP